MWQSTCVPSTVYNVLYKFKPIFRCAQAHHFRVFCWLLIALILDHGKGTLKGLCQYLPPRLKYWTLMRMVRSGQWDADILVSQMAHDALRYLPPPADRVIHLSGDTTRSKRSATQNLTLAMTSFYGIPCRHGNPNGLTT
jgi:hypothetical protein